MIKNEFSIISFFSFLIKDITNCKALKKKNPAGSPLTACVCFCCFIYSVRLHSIISDVFSGSFHEGTPDRISRTSSICCRTDERSLQWFVWNFSVSADFWFPFVPGKPFVCSFFFFFLHGNTLPVTFGNVSRRGSKRAEITITHSKD